MWDHYVFDRDVAHLTTKSEEGHNSNKGVNHSDPELAVDEEFIHHSDNHRKDKRPFFKVDDSSDFAHIVRYCF